MEKRDWQYWQKRMAEWKATGTEPTEDELAEMLQAEDPPGYSPEEAARIRQHGTAREKLTLKLYESLIEERRKIKKRFFEQREDKQDK